MGTGIPKRFRGVSFDRKPICDLDPFVLRPVRAFVERVEDNLDAGRGLWFTGDVGTGKTSLAMLVSQAAERAGRSVAIYPVTRLLAEIKDTYDSDTERRLVHAGSSGGSARWTCSTSTTSAPRSGPSGCWSSSTRSSTSAGRTSARSS